MKIKYITNIDVYNKLSAKEEKTEDEADTLSYVEKFLKYKKNVDIEKLKESLMSTFKLSEEVAVKLIDLKPNNKDELIAVLNSYNIKVDDAQLDAILDTLQVL